jgi:hypothetical protein
MLVRRALARYPQPARISQHAFLAQRTLDRQDNVIDRLGLIDPWGGIDRQD